MLRVIHVLPNFGLGGAERMAVHLMTHLNRDRFRVGAVSLYDRQGTDLEYMLESEGIPVWYLGKRLGFDPRMYPRLESVFREFRPDVIHTHMYVLRYLLPSLLLRRARAWVHTVHNLAEKEVDGVGRGIHRLAFRLGVVPVAIARGVAKSLERVYGLRDVPLIPNGIPVAQYALGEGAGKVWRAKEGFGRSGVLLVSVARFSSQKGHETLVRAFALAAASYPQLRLLLVGDGPLRPNLEGLVRRLGIVDRVRFLGVRTDVPEILAASDVFVLSSWWEGNPLSVMEAMAAGKPVVATAVGGVPELVLDGVSGLLVAPGDVEGLAQAISKLILDAHLRFRMAREALNEARKRFDISVMVRQYEALYDRLLASPQEMGARPNT